MPAGRIRRALAPIAAHHAFVDEWNKRTPAEYTENSPCRKGCWYCCQQMAIVTIPEAMYVVSGLVNDYFGKRWLANMLPEMRRQIEIAQTPGLSNIDWFKRGIRCVFLGGNDLCLVYDRRPVVCRAYRVVEGTAKQCTIPDIRVKCVDTRDIDEKTTEVALAVAADLRIRPYPMPLPMSLHFALVGWWEGLGELRERIRNARKTEAEWSDDGRIVTNRVQGGTD